MSMPPRDGVENDVETCCLLERLRNAKDHVTFTLDMEDYYRIKDAEADKEKGMHVFEWWGGEYHPIEELIAEMDEVKKKQKTGVID